MTQGALLLFGQPLLTAISAPAFLGLYFSSVRHPASGPTDAAGSRWVDRFALLQSFHPALRRSQHRRKRRRQRRHARGRPRQSRDDHAHGEGRRGASLGASARPHPFVDGERQPSSSTLSSMALPCSATASASRGRPSWRWSTAPAILAAMRLRPSSTGSAAAPGASSCCTRVERECTVYCTETTDASRWRRWPAAPASAGTWTWR